MHSKIFKCWLPALLCSINSHRLTHVTVWIRKRASVWHWRRWATSIWMDMATLRWALHTTDQMVVAPSTSITDQNEAHWTSTRRWSLLKTWPAHHFWAHSVSPFPVASIWMAICIRIWLSAPTKPTKWLCSSELSRAVWQYWWTVMYIDLRLFDSLDRGPSSTWPLLRQHLKRTTNWYHWMISVAHCQVMGGKWHVPRSTRALPITVSICQHSSVSVHFIWFILLSICLTHSILALQTLKSRGCWMPRNCWNHVCSSWTKRTRMYGIRQCVCIAARKSAAPKWCISA